MCNNHQHTTTSRVLSAPHAKAKFENTTIERRELRADDVLIDIKFSGICHSDIHSAFDEWGRRDVPDGSWSRNRRSS